MDILDKIKAECGKHKECKYCKLYDFNDESCQMMFDPDIWDIIKIRNLLKESVGNCSTTEIVVPEKWDDKEIEEFSCNIGYRAMACMLYKQNEIIECLRRIKEMLE